METTIDRLYDILIETGVSKKNIEKGIETIHFTHKKITYSVQLDGDNHLIYGPFEFKNGAIDGDYLIDNYTEYGDNVEFEDWVYDVVNQDRFDTIYRMTEKLLKLEEDADDNDIDFPKLVNHMFYYE
jgi:hypothetical protein